MEAGKGQQTNRRGRRKRAAPVTLEERDSYGLAAGRPITPHKRESGPGATPCWMPAFAGMTGDGIG
jgi:hypothetical protein